ncbi:MAG: transcriptional coactivator p15/PC4 family protein [Candidatus Rokubacteria bacterium]|nr:transcriptional coactivator p15/PC4 family protein [Candidatus Rokubacteria bacterium]
MKKEKGTRKDSDQLVSTIEKNPEEEIRVSLREYKGHTFVDIRIYWRRPDGEPGPTRKGVTFNPEFYPEFKKAILALEETLIKKNLVDRDAIQAARTEER